MPLVNYQTRSKFLAEIYNNGLSNYPKLRKYISKYYHNRPIKKFDLIVELVQAAENEEIIYSKVAKEASIKNYRTQIRWYLGQLERNKKIVGFLRETIGRPKKSKLLKDLRRIM